MKKFMNKLSNAPSSNTGGQSGSGRTVAGAPYSQPPGPPPAQPQECDQPPPQQPAYGGGQPGYGGGYAAPPGPPPSSRPSNNAQQSMPGQQAYGAPGGEDPFAALRRYDTVFIVDDSESMEMFWPEVQEALVGVVEKAVLYDDDGIDIYFFNSPVVVNGLRSANDVRNLFRRVEPRRSTPTATALKRVLDPYLAKVEAAHRAKMQAVGGGRSETVKPLSIIVLTDGAPNRGEEPEGVIVNAGRRLDEIRAPPFQLGFQFVQIGSDEEAQQALTYLDDHLKAESGISRDMVDTILFPTNGVINKEYILKALLGGVNRKIDKQN